MLDFVDQYPDLQETPAQFQERCAQIALRCFWKDKYSHDAAVLAAAEAQAGIKQPLASPHAELNGSTSNVSS
jgi:hypothetical protein